MTIFSDSISSIDYVIMYYIYIISYLYIDYTSDFWSVESE